MSTLYSFSAETLAGAPASLDAYRGKVLLIVNTASECGFTPQYAGLQKLYDQYAARGFYVLGFPCNQFGKQARRRHADRCVLRAQLRRHVPDVREDRREGRPCASAVPLPDRRGARHSRSQGDQVEFHEVPGRS